MPIKKAPTLITFSKVNTPKGRFSPYKVIENANMNIIFVNDSGNNWYTKGLDGISSDTFECVQFIIEFAKELGNGKFFTFDTSMGAYGAILFGVLGNTNGLFVLEVNLTCRVKVVVARYI